MENLAVYLYCKSCFGWGVPANGSMQCGNCGSWETLRLEQTEPQMSEQAWNSLAYDWAKWRGINWYHARQDIDDTRKLYGDSRTLQIYLEGMARAHLTKRVPDAGDSAASTSSLQASTESASEGDT